MGPANTLKTLNSGWQVWANTSPASRNPSISSATSETENGYRSNLGDSWTSSRAAGGSWDEDSSAAISLHATRQRQGNGVQNNPLSTPSLGLSKVNQYSPQRYDTSANSASSRYATHSPTRTAYGANTSPFSAQQTLMSSNNSSTSYESAQTTAMAEHDLSLAFRGMAVEDEFGAGQPYRQGGLASQTSAATGQAHASPPQPMRGPHPMQQPRGPFPGYPQAEYTPYYTGPSRVDYPYPYEGYRPNDNMYASSPALSTTTPAPNVYPGMAPHPHAVPDLHNQQFYDYAGSTRPPSQFFYPSQPLMYAPPHSPMTGQTKKRGMQYNPPQPQQLPPQTLIYPNLLYMHSGMSTAIHAQHHGGRRRQEDSNAAFRSQLLEEFRNDKVRKWELKDIFGYVVEFSSDQHGSRFIQQKLESATEEEKQIVFDEIVPQQALHLIQDVFGNYVIQKLFEYGTPIQKTLLTNVMEGHILPLSLQMYGCRVVQKAIENVTPEQQSVFVKELNDSVLRCVKDANGNHVIQRLIERVPPERLDFVKSFRGNVYDLSTHPYGCRVLQRCFEHLPEEHTRPLLDELHKYAIHLMQDQFGNYVIQFVLEHGQPQDRALIISKLRGQMFNMSRHKFASNVCEKALVMADSESRHVLIEEMMTPKHDGVSPVLSMMKDQFANYVLQRALSVVEGDQKQALIDMVKPHLVSMRKYSSHSRHLIAIERLLEKCTPTAVTAEQGQTENSATTDASS